MQEKLLKLKKSFTKLLTATISCVKMTIRKCKREVKELHIDTHKLKGKIVEKGFRMEDFANATGVSVPTLRKYLREPETIPYRFIQECIDVLNLTRTQVRDIFFAA